MHALVFADRPRHELMPLTESVPLPLLQVCGKTLIERTIEDLAAANIGRIIIVLGDHGAATVEKEIGRGGRWGVRIDYVRRHFGESPSQIARRLANRLPKRFLALRGDVYRSPVISSFLRSARNLLATQVVAQIRGRCAQLCLCHKRDLQLNFLSWVPEPLISAPNRQSIDFDDARFFHLHDITDFFLANLEGLDDCVAAANTADELPKRQYVSGPHSRFRPEVICGSPVLIGSGCQISRDAQLVGPIVLGDDVYVGRGAFLYACIVLPGTYIPAGTELRNAVVTNEMAIGIDGKIILRLDEWRTGRGETAN